ncbi:MAG: NifU family protein [Proteobacteria bacterium]|nr:NifU family protein [Pseudomonadota bacterium]
MFIQTEETPNPNTLKFIPGRPVFKQEYDGYPSSFNQGDDASCSLLVFNLLAIENIESVFLGSDFITIGKTENADWYVLKPFILGVIMQHFINDLPVIMTDSIAKKEDVAEPLDDISKKIIDILNDRVRPAVAQDGGDIVFDSFINGVVSLKMRGACAGCPSSTATLKSGIETMLRFYVPEVTEVVQSYD